MPRLPLAQQGYNWGPQLIRNSGKEGVRQSLPLRWYSAFEHSTPPPAHMAAASTEDFTLDPHNNEDAAIEAPMTAPLEPEGAAPVGARHATPAPEPHQIAPVRVGGGCDYVVHGLYIAFAHGPRKGQVLEDNKQKVDLHDSFRMADRAPRSFDLDGDLITGITGFDNNMGFLCHSITLHMTSGRTFSLEGVHAPARGEIFRFFAPEGYHIVELWFADGRYKAARVEPLRVAPGQPERSP